MTCFVSSENRFFHICGPEFEFANSEPSGWFEESRSGIIVCFFLLSSGKASNLCLPSSEKNLVPE
jgi:hypothetical protein